MAGSRADDDPRLGKTVELIFLCPKLGVQEAMQAENFTEEDIISPCFKMRVHCYKHPKKKSPPIDIVSSETAASTLTASPPQKNLN